MKTIHNLSASNIDGPNILEDADDNDNDYNDDDADENNDNDPAISNLNCNGETLDPEFNPV